MDTQLVQVSGSSTDFADSIISALADIYHLIESILVYLIQCGEGTYPDVTESATTQDERDDWTSILVFIMIVKCRTSIGKILDADEED